MSSDAIEGEQSYLEDQIEHHQWLEEFKDLCATTIEWMDEILDDITPREDVKPKESHS